MISQNYDELEYIIIDGGSTDGTLDIIKKYEGDIAYFVSEQDKGISDAFNKGIHASGGDYIGIINSDDFLAEDALSNIRNYAEKYEKADVLYGDMTVLNQNGQNYVCRPREDISNIKHHFMICHPSVFVKKEAYRKYGVFDTRFRYAMDFELLSRFYLKGAFFQYVPVMLSFFRKGGTSKRNADQTVYESIHVSVRNGTKPSDAKKYYKITNQSQKLSDWMGRIGIEPFLRKMVKGQKETVDEVYWFHRE